MKNEMKTKIFFVVIIMQTICSCTKLKEHDFLYLNADQLRSLGIELNERGLFYKNENPEWNQDNERYSCLAFYCTNDNYVSTKLFNITDTLKIVSSIDSLLATMEFTKNDFGPLLIGNIKGNQSMENENIPIDMKLLPVAICMAETNLSNRKDTIVVWLKPTVSLKKALPWDVNMDDYLRTRPSKI